MTDAFHPHSPDTISPAISPNHQIHPNDSSGHEDGPDRQSRQHAFAHHRALLERNGRPNRQIYQAAEANSTKAKGKDEAPPILLKLESKLMPDQFAHKTVVSQ